MGALVSSSFSDSDPESSSESLSESESSVSACACDSSGQQQLQPRISDITVDQLLQELGQHKGVLETFQEILKSQPYDSRIFEDEDEDQY